MKQFESQLKTIQNHAKDNDGFVYAPTLDICEYDLRYLAAKDLIKLRPAGDNEFYITLEKLGITYFDDKRENRRLFIVNHLIKFVGGFASGVITTLLATWLLQVLWR